MKYFKDCNSIEEVKGRYKKLALENHPDRGGDTATMQAINAEYAFAIALLLKGSKLSAEQKEQELHLSEEYRNVIEQIIFLPGIRIELVGRWIWVTGNTRAVKDQLYAAKLHYAPKKEAWYYRSEIFKVFRGGRKTLDQIRRKYGSEEIETKSRTHVSRA